MNNLSASPQSEMSESMSKSLAGHPAKLFSKKTTTVSELLRVLKIQRWMAFLCTKHECVCLLSESVKNNLSM